MLAREIGISDLHLRKEMRDGASCKLICEPEVNPDALYLCTGEFLEALIFEVNTALDLEWSVRKGLVERSAELREARETIERFAWPEDE